MNIELLVKLAELKEDFRATTGSPFAHFFCPILFVDECVPLIKAHLFNAAFPGSPRDWTVQRKDVDNFYGAFFESDFVELRHSSVTGDQVIQDRELHMTFRPHITVGGEKISHFIAHGPVPSSFTQVVIEGSEGQTSLGLKMTPQEFIAAGPETFEIHFNRDLRLGSVASLLKCAHLVLFDMLGYRYALSPGGQFLGKVVLGNFFLESRELKKYQAVETAMPHFRQFLNMVRPVVSLPDSFAETSVSKCVHICMTKSAIPWAMVVYLRTAEHWHAVLVPVLDTSEGAEEFFDFISGPGGLIKVRDARLYTDKWHLSGTEYEINWVDAGWSS